ncbi:FHA domain-containing protein [Streptomyces sp. TLI_235]|nr:FHA domain-containing protein [Streptomyces sp. TLI_235]PBC77383.1 FHA domain-containing protein [Streptomyces sp. TLI_235]
MPICPRGHESQAEDWCDFCGFPMTPPPGLAVPGAPPAGGSPFGAPAGPGYPPPPPASAPPAPPAGAGGAPGYGGRGGYERPPYEPSGPEAGYDQGYDPGYGQQPYEEPARERRGGLGGLSIGGGSAHGPAHGGPPHGGPSHGGSPDITAGLVTCPICRTPQTGRYCEECGYDYDLSAPQRPQAPTPPPVAPPTAPPPPPAGPGGGYGYPPPSGAPAPAPSGYQPPSLEKQGFDRPAPAPFAEPDGYERTGPVYAEPTGGDGFGTSFRLAPPGPGQQAPGHAPGRPAPGGPPHGHPGAGPAVPPPPPPPTRTQWIAVVSADRDYFADMMVRSGPDAAGLFFPPYCPERRIPLTGRGQLRIGRRSQQRGTVPEIDLSVPPEDPGASHQHAMLAEQPDGSWVLVDQDSTNGTTMNGGAEPVPPHTAIPLNDGDRIHIGAWTTITLHRA